MIFKCCDLFNVYSFYICFRENPELRICVNTPIYICVYGIHACVLCEHAQAREEGIGYLSSINFHLIPFEAGSLFEFGMCIFPTRVEASKLQLSFCLWPVS